MTEVMDESNSLADYEDRSDSVVECINGHLGVNSQSGVSDKLAEANLEVSSDVGGAKNKNPRGVVFYFFTTNQSKNLFRINYIVEDDI